MDFIALTEAFPKHCLFPPLIDEFRIQGFQLFSSDDDFSSGRGVLIYVRNGISVNQIFFKKEKFVESVWISVKERDIDILFGCVYRSPSSSLRNNISLNSLFREVHKSSFSDLIIVGDFNYRSINWDLSCVSSEDGDSSRNFFDTINHIILML